MWSGLTQLSRVKTNARTNSQKRTLPTLFIREVSPRSRPRRALPIGEQRTVHARTVWKSVLPRCLQPTGLLPLCVIVLGGPGLVPGRFTLVATVVPIGCGGPGL